MIGPDQHANLKEAILQRIQTDRFLMDLLPETIDDRKDFAYNPIPRVLDQVFGKQGEKWHTYRKMREDSGGTSTYIKAGPPEVSAASEPALEASDES